MSATQDGSESVDQFLARISSIREGRDQANEDKTRRMEEDFLKSRKERQARRLERARSLSPSKTGPARSFEPSPTPKNDLVLNAPVDFSPRNSTLSRSNAVRTSPVLPSRQSSEEPTSVSSLSAQPPLASTTSLTRSGTLSWQQRPTARDSGFVRPRPLSSIATVRPVGEDAEPDNEQTEEPTRQEIAASLGLKDPSWFRQTQDRSTASAAYRKSQVEDTVVAEHTVKSMRLPGLSHERLGSSEPGGPEPQAPSASPRFDLAKTPVQGSPGSKSATPAKTPLLEPSTNTSPPPYGSADQASTSSNVADSIGLGARPASPTKGLGGFVQSAMMKRSDSVNKRWTVQANTGLKRGDSLAVRRPQGGLGSVASRPSPQEPRLERNSPQPSLTVNPRPASRDGATTTQPMTTTAGPEANSETKTDVQDDVQSKENPDSEDPEQAPVADESRLARSPSKTLDQRRWSPTKSSWLESVLLTKQEPPKLSPSKEEQPGWLVELQKTKASRDPSPEKTGNISQKSVPSAKPRPLSTVESSGSWVSSGWGSKLNPGSLSKAEPVESPAPVSPATRHNDAERPMSKEVEGGPEVTPSRSVHGAASEVGSSSPKPIQEKKPPAIKPKPQTPPKTDFRASLRSRGLTTGSGDTPEPEFKAMVGKLKPAHTKNYVAPDELKTNILQGKAGLSVTGGPQKTKRVDEFKESILQKKEAMKTGALQKKQEADSAKPRPEPEPVLPEALVRRRTLHKATPSITKIQDTFGSSSPRTAEDKPKPIIAAKPKDKPSPAMGVNTLVQTKSTDTRPPPEQRKQSSAPAQTLPKQDTTDVSGPTTEKAFEAPQGPTTPTTLPNINVPRKAELPPGSKLASRLNPNLASLLSAGGGPRPAPGRSLSSDGASAIPSISNETSTAQASGAGELTHVTKGRAKGPKRRAPKGQANQIAATTSTEEIPEQREPVSVTRKEPISAESAKRVFSPPQVFTAPKFSKSLTNLSVQTQNEGRTALSDEVGRSTDDKIRAKPSIAAKSPELRRVSSSLGPPTSSSKAPSPAISKQFEIASDKSPLPPPKSQSADAQKSPVPKVQAGPAPLTPSKSRINTTKTPHYNATPPTKPSSPKPSFSQSPSTRTVTPTTKPVVTKATTETLSKDVVANKIPKSATSREGESAQAILNSYFGTKLNASDKVEYDIQSLLATASPFAEKIKTISATVCEITGGGKKTMMPPQQEHILYEESMYLVIHMFEQSPGRKTSEVYLWCGDCVSEAAAEDAQIFGRKDAREHSAKLELVRQGKESSRFFQALGGIVIVRRSKSSALYMLCGRRHKGHVAFDEVDMQVANLCPGYPFLVSAPFGKLYLWKGAGSGADEVGGARLIGMDLGLTGEIEEIEEGREPAAFWEAFPQLTEKRQWAREWSQRSEHGGYPSCLYRVEQARPKSAGGFWGLRSASPPKSSNKAIVERIEPFAYRDIEAGSVYIVDAYHSIYVLVDSKGSSKTTEFVTAAHAAQDMALLSPSIQNRSLMPSSFIAFGELPHDVKACFRKWPSETKRESDKPSACVRLEEVMEALHAG